MFLNDKLRLRFIAATILLAGVSASAVGATATPPASMRDAVGIETAREKVYPCLINIQMVSQSYGGGQAQRALGGGSGVIVTSDGYALTNFHVVGHATHITCTLQSGEAFDARIVLNDSATDLSVIKLQLPPGKRKQFSFAQLGNSDTLQAGDPVLAMGNPLMLSSSMTLGIVSNPHRVFTDFQGSALENRQLEGGENTGAFTRWIQHDALILPGNSGGPLVDYSGQVVGINELGGNGVGFAIPANIARFVLQSAISTGQVVRGTLNLSVLPVDKLRIDGGALVEDVEPGGSAEKAGVKPGDILTSIGKTPVVVKYFEQVPTFYQLVANLSPGTTTDLTVSRAGKAVTLKATVSRLAPNIGDEYEETRVGATMRELTSQTAIILGLVGVNGVLVTGTRAGQLFDGATPPITMGDVITQVNEAPVKSLADMRRSVADLMTRINSGKLATVSIRRGHQNLISVIKKPVTNPPDSSFDIPRAWIGVQTQVMTTELANALGTAGQTGLRVTEVFQGTSAAKAGLLPGDTIIAVNGDALLSSRPQDGADLIEYVRNLKVGDTADISILRAGKPMHIPVAVEADPSEDTAPTSSESPELELTVRELNRIDRIAHEWDSSVSGLLVTSVIGGGWSHVAGVHVGDLVLAVDGTPTPTVAAFKAALAPGIKSHARTFTLYLRRDNTTHFVFVEPDWSQTP